MDGGASNALQAESNDMPGKGEKGRKTKQMSYFPLPRKQTMSDSLGQSLSIEQRMRSLKTEQAEKEGKVFSFFKKADHV